MWPELDAPSGALALFAVAWLSWAALWIGLVFFLACELVGLGAPYLAAQRGVSAGLWSWLLVATGVLLTSVAWLNYKNTKYLLMAERRAGLEQAIVAGALFTVVLAAVAWARRPQRFTLLGSTTAAVALLAFLWGSWAIAPHSHRSPAGTNPLLPTPAPAPILFVVWEGADLAVLLPAMERGDMPFLKERWGQASWGQLRTLRPYARAAALNTLMTGCLPAEHGVAGRRVYRLAWLQAEPLTLLLEGPWPTPHQLPWRAWERAAAPPPRRATLWHILESAGHRVGVVGWYAPTRASWVIPRVLAAEATPFQFLDPSLQAVLRPALESSREFAPATREAFAVAHEEYARATTQLRTDPPAALFLVSDLLGRLRPLWTSAFGDPARAEVLRQACRLLDEQLAGLWRGLGGEAVTLVVASPYGMAPPGSWTRLQLALRGSRRWQVAPSSRADGFVLLAGPAIKQGARISGARVADVAPTLLYLMDLPLAQDMGGKVLLEAVPEEVAATRPLRLIPSYPNPERGR